MAIGINASAHATPSAGWPLGGRQRRRLSTGATTAAASHQYAEPLQLCRMGNPLRLRAPTPTCGSEATISGEGKRMKMMSCHLCAVDAESVRRARRHREAPALGPSSTEGNPLRANFQAGHRTRSSAERGTLRTAMPALNSASLTREARVPKRQLSSSTCGPEASLAAGDHNQGRHAPEGSTSLRSGRTWAHSGPVVDARNACCERPWTHNSECRDGRGPELLPGGAGSAAPLGVAGASRAARARARWPASAPHEMPVQLCDTCGSSPLRPPATKPGQVGR